MAPPYVSLPLEISSITLSTHHSSVHIPLLHVAAMQTLQLNLQHCSMWPRVLSSLCPGTASSSSFSLCGLLTCLCSKVTYSLGCPCSHLGSLQVYSSRCEPSPWALSHFWVPNPQPCHPGSPTGAMGKSMVATKVWRQPVIVLFCSPLFLCYP